MIPPSGARRPSAKTLGRRGDPEHGFPRYDARRTEVTLSGAGDHEPTAVARNVAAVVMVLGGLALLALAALDWVGYSRFVASLLWR